MKKPVIVSSLVVACLFLSAHAYSGQKDSLLNELKLMSNPVKRFDALQQLYELSYQDNFYEAEKYQITALGISNQLNNYRFMVTSYKRLAELYEQQNNLSRAYLFFQEAKKIAENQDCLDHLPELNYKTGVVLYSLDRFNEAIVLLNAAGNMASTQNDTKLALYASLFRNFALYRNGEKNLAVTQLQQLLQKVRNSDNSTILAFFYYYLQSFYTVIQQYDKALQFNQEAYSLFNQQKNNYYSLLCLKDKAAIYVQKNNPQKVIALYRDMLQNLQSGNYFNWMQAMIFDSLAGYYARENDSILSRYYSRKAEKINDSLMVSVKPLLLNMSDDTTEHNRPQKGFSLINTAIGLALAAMTFVILILTRRYRKMKRIIKAEREMAFLSARLQEEEAKQKALEHSSRMFDEKKGITTNQAGEKAVTEAREILEKTKEEARMLQAEVATTSVLLANKNDYLLQIQEKLKTTDDVDLRKLAKEIKNNMVDTDYWANYIKNFNQLHSQFLDKLTKQHPDLTASELKLVCFIMTGLNNKEIAAIFSVEPESVKKARYRLKKKLNLTEEENLVTYLHSLQ